MRRAEMLATIVSTVRKAADDHAIRLRAAEERAEARAKAHDDRLEKLSADIGDLADATRAVLLRQRDPEPAAAAKAPAQPKPRDLKEKM
ncbi:MAG TPA: hypothetical protein VMV92_13220 [Streptosporangiaceae bacterium]|nr:hypothetical protein [Streptosporangiaceae bacterium]